MKTYSKGGQEAKEIKQAFSNSKLAGYTIGAGIGGLSGEQVGNLLGETIADNVSQGLQEIFLVAVEQGATAIHPVIGFGIKFAMGGLFGFVGSKISESLTRKYILRTTYTNNYPRDCFPYNLVFDPVK
ncbi:hypothetical protein [Okeania sp. SIO2B3]|uniref:hypothetical protein n=1 Tax=Okeania sp. SIO2B3 TaxID=2607784 RepID=UPI0013BED7AF|nr:hypothetical protein [Okeania sp. SIO2B3]NET41439.1 hypothetical protein [Okeania sp. SIO2B3]